jgi:hypothetical protein
LKDYRAVVELEPTPAGGTVISWRGSWRMKPVIGWGVPFVLPRVMQRMADDLASHAADATRGRRGDARPHRE